MNGNRALSFSEAGLECEAFFPFSDTIIISEIFPLLGLLYPGRVDVTCAQVRPLVARLTAPLQHHSAPPCTAKPVSNGISHHFLFLI